MITAVKKTNESLCKKQDAVAFYVLLWKKPEIDLEVFDDYWRNVHGPVCARLPGQHQYWQFHVAHSQAYLWSQQEYVQYSLPPEDQFDGIAELTFINEAERQTWFDAASILMNDEPNIFSKAIGYNTSPGNSITYIDALETKAPNGKLDVLKFHVMVKKASGVSIETFRQYMRDDFANAVAQSEAVLKFRLHLFEAVDSSRADAKGVVHIEPLEKQYQGAFEIAFASPSKMKEFFASTEYLNAVKDRAKYVKQVVPFPERSANTFVYNGQLTLAGQRSSTVAKLITQVGATNQLEEDILSLLSQQTSSNGNYSGKPHKAAFSNSAPNPNAKQKGVALERFPGVGTDLVKRLFARGEAFDSKGFIDFFTDTPIYQFGNMEPCLNKEAIEKSVDAFFSQISALYHDIKMTWEVGDIVFVEMDVIYWRKDESVVKLPCFDILRLQDNKLAELRIFMDASPLSDSQANIPETVSVLTVGQGNTLPSPQLMKQFYVQDDEGQKRAANGSAPKWMADNFESTLDEFLPGAGNLVNKQTMETMETMTDMSVVEKLGQYVIDEEWNEVKELLTDNVLYRVGSNEPVYGKQAVVDYLSSLFENTAKLTRHDVRKVWDEPGIVSIEMDAKYTINRNNKRVSIACCDIYRLKDKKINEWRVYADLAPFQEN